MIWPLRGGRSGGAVCLGAPARRGVWVPGRDIAKACFAFREAGRGRSGRAAELAYLHLNGDGILSQPDAAAAYLRKPARRRGCPVRLGRHRRRQERKRGRPLVWARRRATGMSARRSSTRSSSSTGCWDDQGRGGRGTRAAGSRLQGQCRGATSLGALLAEGKGVEQNQVKAARLYLHVARARGCRERLGRLAAGPRCEWCVGAWPAFDALPGAASPSGGAAAFGAPPPVVERPE